MPVMKESNDLKLLESLLDTLINNWGRDAVVSILQTSQNGSKSSDKEKAKRPVRPAPVKQVADLTLAKDRKRLLLKIAEQYQGKRMFEKVGEAKSYLSMRGIDVSDLKTRPDVFPKFLNLLLEMPNKTLEKIVKEGLEVKPSTLGNLSDAMRNVGHSIRAEKVN